MFVHVQDSVHASLAYVQKPIRKHKSMQTRVNLCVQIQGHECVEAMHTNIVHLLQVYTCEQAVCVQACVCESLIHVFASPSECVCMHAQVYVCLCDSNHAFNVHYSRNFVFESMFWKIKILKSWKIVNRI